MALDEKWGDHQRYLPFKLRGTRMRNNRPTGPETAEEVRTNEEDLDTEIILKGDKRAGDKNRDG